jgi:TolB protein
MELVVARPFRSLVFGTLLLALVAAPARASVPPPAANGLIAFVTVSGDPNAVFSIRPDGGGERQLTAPGQYSGPAWSPDGSELLFVGHMGGVPSQIFETAADGSGSRQLTFGWRGASDPAWSPDGRHIAFARWDGHTDRLVTMNTTTGRIRTLTQPGVEAIEPSWSPNSKRIAFRTAPPSSGLSHIEILDIHTGQTEAVTTSGPPDSPDWHDDQSPAWSPDGSRIAFTRCHVRCWIEVVKTDGTDPRALTAGPWDSDPAWSPDGTQIAFDTVWDHDGGPFDIAVMDADGSDPRPVTLTPDRTELSPAWQPVR